MNHFHYSPATPTPYNGTSSTAIISPSPAASKGSTNSLPSSFYPQSPHHHHHQVIGNFRWLPPHPTQLLTSQHAHHHPLMQETPTLPLSPPDYFAACPTYRDIGTLQYRGVGNVMTQTHCSGGTGGDVSARSYHSSSTAGSANYSRKEKSLCLLASKIISMHEGQTARIEGKACNSRMDDNSSTTTTNLTTSKKRKYEKGHSSSPVLLKWDQEEDDAKTSVSTEKPDHDRTRSSSIEKDNMKKAEEKEERRSPTKATTPFLSIDQTASQLRVERRRIYDIINILEALNIVSKKGKNVYWWHGLQDLEATLSRFQSEAMRDKDGLLVDAEQNGMCDDGDETRGWSANSIRSNVGAVGSTSSKISAELDDNNSVSREGEKSSRKACTDLLRIEETLTQTDSTSGTSSRDSNTTNPKCTTTFGSLGLLSKRFLQLYLVGYNSFSLGDATIKLLGDGIDQAGAEHLKASTSEDDTMNTKRGGDESRGFKIKVRRLYDIANVFVSIGVIEKTTNQSSPTSYSTNITTASSNHSRTNVGRDGRNLAVPLHKNNQYYRWNYAVTPQELLRRSLKRERMTGSPLLVANKYVR